MKRLRKRRHNVEHDNVHRWLVSYADYMTLLFALFVVLYAMAMVNDKAFESITESVGHVFQANDKKIKNRGHGDDILDVNTSKSNKILFGNGIVEEAGPELFDDEKDLLNISAEQLGSNLTSLEADLHTALFDLIESGFSQVKIDGDWLEIELNSGLLFPSGSSSVTNTASNILGIVYDVIGDVNNFVRVRGYTDNQAINTEIFSSNWELSVFRATAILRELEKIGVNPARMAIEGYGQYSPSADNTTAEGRARNRKVVIAVSKYGLKKVEALAAPSNSIEEVKDKMNVVEANGNTGKVQVIQLPGGGIRITTRNNNESSSEDKVQQSNNQQNDDN
ncbi:flagellar motor protein MotB [Colwellia sp. 6_MG-2023]|uniref:flagellar motor protein MotB n=1 Tax=Colwellia sp. 6_MG-2023 TaxID=3062676 RepID=UPI0026E1513A|nr:flagellar motor protein MotB [Colwellia sp. 6_MG-2023]MDO6486748.1 flagellar motor protein MotB [Colwellia sp. 6_MG-2023]